MSALPDRFIEDRDLRDSAKAVFQADLEHARHSLSTKGVAERLMGRVTGRIGEGTKDAVEVGIAAASANRSVIGLIVGLLVLWFSRDSLAEGLSALFAELDEADTQEALSEEPESIKEDVSEDVAAETVENDEHPAQSDETISAEPESATQSADQ